MAEVEDEFDTQPGFGSKPVVTEDGISPSTAESGQDSAFEPTFGIEEVDEQMKEASKCIREDNFQHAIAILYRVLSLLVEKYGEMALECAEAYAAYGVALMGQARKDASALGEETKDAAPGGEEEEQAEEDEEEEEREFNFVRGAKPDAAAAAPQQAEQSADAGENAEDLEDGDNKKETAQDLELSLENLEVARTIYARNIKLLQDRINASGASTSSSSSSSSSITTESTYSKEEDEQKLAKLEQALADVCESLGEAGMEAETWDQALTDLTTCATIRSRMCAPSSRRLASVHNMLGLYYSVQSLPQRAMYHYNYAIASLTHYMASCACSALTAAGRKETGVNKIPVPTLLPVTPMSEAGSTETATTDSSSSSSSTETKTATTESTSTSAASGDIEQPADYFAYVNDPSAILRAMSNEDGEKLIAGIRTQFSSAIAVLSMSGADVNPIKAAKAEVDEVVEIRTELLERIAGCQEEIKAGITSPEDAKRVKELVQKIMSNAETAPAAASSTVGVANRQPVSVPAAKPKANTTTAPRPFVWSPPETAGTSSSSSGFSSSSGSSSSSNTGSTDATPVVNVPQVKRKIAPTSLAGSTTTTSSTTQIGFGTPTGSTQTAEGEGEKRVKLNE